MSISIRDNGTWKKSANQFIKVVGKWKAVTKTFMKVSGHWIDIKQLSVDIFDYDGTIAVDTDGTRYFVNKLTPTKFKGVANSGRVAVVAGSPGMHQTGDVGNNLVPNGDFSADHPIAWYSLGGSSLTIRVRDKRLECAGHTVRHQYGAETHSIAVVGGKTYRVVAKVASKCSSSNSRVKSSLTPDPAGSIQIISPFPDVLLHEGSPQTLICIFKAKTDSHVKFSFTTECAVPARLHFYIGPITLKEYIDENSYAHIRIPLKSNSNNLIGNPDVDVKAPIFWDKGDNVNILRQRSIFVEASSDKVGTYWITSHEITVAPGAKYHVHLPLGQGNCSIHSRINASIVPSNSSDVITYSKPFVETPDSHAGQVLDGIFSSTGTKIKIKVISTKCTQTRRFFRLTKGLVMEQVPENIHYVLLFDYKIGKFAPVANLSGAMYDLSGGRYGTIVTLETNSFTQSDIDKINGEPEILIKWALGETTSLSITKGINDRVYVGLHEVGGIKELATIGAVTISKVGTKDIQFLKLKTDAAGKITGVSTHIESGTDGRFISLPLADNTKKSYKVEKCLTEISGSAAKYIETECTP